ncbi:MAG: D-tyrosyl-tRNA(Tyr) deacylase [Gammaproteobacteria bacterium]|nr:D-tyrosyl-tRNA(Tyr) deacylase [Gammaproteobacteria bacterium]
MIALIQRVSRAEVLVDQTSVARIDRGLLVLAGVEKGDRDAQAERLAQRICGYRVFPDDTGRMNRSVIQVDGGILLVPQFTLAANTDKGMRASFTTAEPPESGRQLFDELCGQVGRLHKDLNTGVFGADMAVSLINDGPVTFWLRVPPVV